MQQLIIGSLIAFVLFIGLFLVVRAFWLWYWRVNAIVGLLESMRDELRTLNSRSVPRLATSAAPAQAPPSFVAPPLLDTRPIAPSPQAAART